MREFNVKIEPMGKNIILLHGWGAETKKLAPLGKELQKLGWKVYIPELPGFEKPAPDTVWGIKEYSEYIKDGAKKIFNKNKYFVFGHSFGGGIAIKLASNPPNNLSGIILCATRGMSRGKVVKRIFFSSLAKAGKVLLITPIIADKFKKLLYKSAREHDYEKLDGIMRDIFKKVISEDLRPNLKDINIPGLVLWGGLDRMTPIKDAYYIDRNLKGSKLIIFKDQGHRLPYEKGKELAKEIEKWNKELN